MLRQWTTSFSSFFGDDPYCDLRIFLQDTNILDPTISAYGMYAMETGCALVRMRNSCVSCIDIDVGFYFTILHSHAIRDEDALS
jgi:hypothetical protein